MDWAACADSRRRMDVAAVSGVEGTWVPAVHAACPHNEVAALVLRSLAPLPGPVFEPVGADVSSVYRRLARIGRAYGGVKWSNLETAQTYTGAMRRRYAEAERSLREEGPLTWRDSYLRPFLKSEKICLGTKLPKPRLIYPRSPRYNLRLASWLKPFEHWLWGYLTAGRLFGHKAGGRVVAKGLSPRGRANLIVRKFKAIPNCRVFEVDASAFEAHVGPSQLEGEHQVYTSAYPRSGELVRLLDEQKVLRGRLPCGAKFSRPGARASGDFNTGMGNSLTMTAVIVGALESLTPLFDVLVDGDNALVFLPEGVVKGVVAELAPHVLLSSGHEVVLEREVSVVEEIRFGRSAPVFLGPSLGWRMVRDWKSVLSGSFASHRWLREPTFAREWCAGVAMCELSLALGVPVLQAWALNALRTLGFRGRVRGHPFRDYFTVGASFAGEEDAVPVSQEARRSFERAFGLDPEAQARLECSFGPVVPRGFVGVEHSWLSSLCPPGLREAWISWSI